MAVIRLHLSLIERAGNRQVTLEGPLPEALASVLERLGVPPEEVGIIVRNGRTEDIDCLIHKGDKVDLFPVISGG